MRTRITLSHHPPFPNLGSRSDLTLVKVGKHIAQHIFSTYRSWLPQKLEHFFFIFQEEKKIMYYFPDETDIDSKIKNIGLSEAIVQYSS